MKNLTIGLGLLMAMLACGSEPKEGPRQDGAAEKIAVPELLLNALQAHGGLEQWQQYASLKYSIQSSLGGKRQETHLVNLGNRMVRIEADNYTLGMDGNEVWVSPNKAAFGELSPRFYHNLVFYFLAIPYVLADQGVLYDDLGEQTVAGKTYRALKISYEAGTGDSPEDFYVAHFNPKTYKLELVLYTVTYFSGEQTTQFNCLLYPEWTEVGGLLLPTLMEGYKFSNDSIGELRYQIEISDIELQSEAPDSSAFVMPTQAEVDSLKQ